MWGVVGVDGETNNGMCTHVDIPLDVEVGDVWKEGRIGEDVVVASESGGVGGLTSRLRVGTPPSGGNGSKVAPSSILKVRIAIQVVKVTVEIPHNAGQAVRMEREFVECSLEEVVCP